MAKLFLLVLFALSLLCFLEVSPDPTFGLDHVSYVNQVGLRGTNRRLMQDLGDFGHGGRALVMASGIAPPLAPTPAPVSVPAPVPIPGAIDCGGLCEHRCSLHSRPNLCNRACGTCCIRCKCVPPGTSGNREMCGSCYADMTTHHNKTKCP